jgi:hypothetical protein
MDEHAHASLAYLDSDTGRVDILRDLAKFPYDSGLAVLPDRSAVVFARTDSVEADLMLLDGI